MHLLVALKVYKELERMLKVSEIKMSVDKVLALAKTITTIQIKRPLNKDVYTQTMLMARHQKIAKLLKRNLPRSSTLKFVALVSYMTCAIRTAPTAICSSSSSLAICLNAIIRLCLMIDRIRLYKKSLKPKILWL